ncbi:hypothetical protein CF5_0009 [Staphylococcus phage CF5]|uniref:Uncharacterized protein n=1 Tax=Staphylococcus phage CF5 TaxID=3113739 RepID=A0AAX4J7G1_9CAUD|nr:hypothetical protein CF5_0009 [Staphylococcus phage CF5]
MDKRTKERKWRRFFESYDIEYTYKEHEMSWGTHYKANPSFYLPNEDIYIHVGNRCSDNITKDTFIYEKAVKENLFNDVFVTSDLPEDVLDYRQGILFSIKEKKIYRLLVEESKLIVEESKLIVEEVTKKNPNKRTATVSIIDTPIESLDDVEKVLQLSLVDYECLPIYESEILGTFEPKKVFHKQVDRSITFAGIKSDNFVITIGNTKEVDNNLGTQGLKEQCILVQGNHKGKFCYSLYRYLIRNNRF